MISLLNHPGMILLITCVISYVVYRLSGLIQRGALKSILRSTLNGGMNSSLGILAMVGVASIMMHSGMTFMLAQGLSVNVQRDLYPLVSPFIGALGAFITGSNNNSNVLFAVLQQSAAELLDISVPLILAAQTAGGALGSVLAPAKVIVGSSTVGLAGQEGVVMRKLMVYGLVTIGTVAIAALILHLLSSGIRMKEHRKNLKKAKASSLKVRFSLLAVQIILPFLLYLFMQQDIMIGAYAAAGLIVLSTGVLVCLN